MDEKLLEALKLIRDFCENHESCVNCPLRSTDPTECSVVDEYCKPEDWRFVSESEAPRRIFL